MGRSRSGRLLAPLALIACAAAVLLVVRSTLGEGNGTTGSRSESRSGTNVKAGGERSSRRRSRRRNYTVRPGDSLSAIAERTGVSVERILRLNDGLDPQSLRAGQRLRLRR